MLSSFNLTNILSQWMLFFTKLQREYQNKIQIINYNFLDINLDYRNDDSQARSNNQEKEKGELSLSVIVLDER